jgi:rRNA maturation endonuclease Nob1
VLFRSRASGGSNPQSSQAPIGAPAQAQMTTSYRCSNCGTDVDPNTKYCGNCGAQLKKAK